MQGRDNSLVSRSLNKAFSHKKLVEPAPRQRHSCGTVDISRRPSCADLIEVKSRKLSALSKFVAYLPKILKKKSKKQPDQETDKCLTIELQIKEFIEESIVFGNERTYGVSSLMGRRSTLEDSFRIITNVEAYVNQVIQYSKLVSKRLMSSSSVNAVAAVDGDECFMNGLSTNQLSSLGEVIKDALKKQDYTKTEFYGVFDGHGGQKCAQNLGKWLLLHIMQTKKLYSQTSEAIKEGHMSMDQDLTQKEAITNVNDGSTSIIAIKLLNELWIANVGDCRAVLRTATDTIAMSIDHKPDVEAEKKRIEEAGGMVLKVNGVSRVNGILGVARAFGDSKLKSCVTCQPDINRHVLTSGDRYIVLACDGLWDVLSNQQVTEFIDNLVDKFTMSTIADKLASTAFKEGSTDNITVVIVDLRQMGKEEHLDSEQLEKQKEGSKLDSSSK